MKKMILYGAFLVVPVFQLFAQFNMGNFSKLYALEGAWKKDRKTGGTLYEIWKIINDSTMEGHSYSVLKNDTTKLESVSLNYHNGVISYTPTTFHQNEQQPVVFVLADITRDTFLFENKAHDFPQFIRYTIPTNGQLMASISGELNHRFRKVEFKYERHQMEKEK